MEHSAGPWSCAVPHSAGPWISVVPHLSGIKLHSAGSIGPLDPRRMSNLFLKSLKVDFFDIRPIR
jgi:hypothetical protein